MNFILRKEMRQAVSDIEMTCGVRVFACRAPAHKTREFFIEYIYKIAYDTT